ncbi:MAG: hypothetical protein ACOY3I_06050 [Verrucomicrobiota bacterium]
MEQTAQEPALTPVQTALFSKACEASERGNHDYAIALLSNLVKELPDWLEARRLLRVNELSRYKGKPSAVNAVKIAHYALRGRMALKSAPWDAMDIAEDILLIDPTNQQGNELLAEAAVIVESSDIEILACETLREAYPDHVGNLKRLCQAYVRARELSLAHAVYEKILTLDPNDNEALKCVRDICALQAMQENQKTKEPVKNTLDDISKPVAIESLVVMSESTPAAEVSSAPASTVEQTLEPLLISEESVLVKIQELHSQLDVKNPNSKLAQQIGEMYEFLEKFDIALEWYEYAFDASGKSNADIEKAILRLKVSHAPTPAPAQEEEPVHDSDAEKEKIAYLLEQTLNRSRQYPNDLTLRFELGEALVHAERYHEAIPELQRSLRHPYVRHQAYNLLGYCFQKRNMLDLAKKQYESALTEMPMMDEIKKEITYNLACVLEAMNLKSAAIEELKKIYEVDALYRDVARRVENSYQLPQERALTQEASFTRILADELISKSIN